MRTLKVLLFLLVFPLIVNSQSEMEWGPDMTRSEVRYFRYADGDALWAVTRENDDFYFTKYENLKQVKKVKDDIQVSYGISLGFGSGGIGNLVEVNAEDFNKVIGIVKIKDAPYAIMRTGGLLKDIKWSIDLVPINDGKALRENAITVFNSKDEGFPGIPRIMQYIYFDQSPDRSKLAIGFTNKLDKVWDECNLSVAVVDENFQVIHKKYYEYPYKIDVDLSKFDGAINTLLSAVGETEEITLAGRELTKEKNMRITCFKVTDEGEVLTLAKVLQSEKVEGAYPYKYSLFKFDFTGESKKPIEKKLYDVPNYQEINVWLYEKKDGSLFVWGGYSEGNMYKARKKSRSMIGTYYEVIDIRNMTTLDAGHSLIDTEILIASYRKPKKARKKIPKKGVEDYGLRWFPDLKMLDDETFISVVPRTYRIETAEVNGEQKFKFINEGAFVYYFNEKGEFIKHNRFYLKHKIKSKRRAPYGMRSKIEQDGTVHFLFNDHPKNNANYTQKLKKFKGKKKSSLMLATLTKEGKLTKKELCYNKPDKRTPWINSTFWNNNTVYMYSSKKEGYQLGKYTLK